MTLKFEQAAHKYLARLRHERRSLHHASAKRVLTDFCQDAGSKTLDDIDESTILRWIERHDWSPNTMRSVASVFNAAMRHSGRHDISLRKHLPRPEIKTPPCITAEQHSTLVDAASPELANVLTTLWTTGARQGEIASAQVDQIRSNNYGLMIVQDRSKLPNRPRVIYVPPKTADLIRSLVADSKDGSIFRSANGVTWTTAAVRNAFLRLCRKAGIGGFPLKCYRNAAAYRLRTEGVDPDTIARLLGYAPRLSESFVRPNEKRIWKAVKMLEEEQ